MGRKKPPLVEGSRGSRADLEVDQATSKPIMPQAKIVECDDDHISSSDTDININDKTKPNDAKGRRGGGVGNDNTEGSIEYDGKEMFVVRNGVRIAKRRRKDKDWVSLMPGVTVRDCNDRDRQEIEIIYSGSEH